MYICISALFPSISSFIHMLTLSFSLFSSLPLLPFFLLCPSFSHFLPLISSLNLPLCLCRFLTRFLMNWTQ